MTCSSCTSVRAFQSWKKSFNGMIRNEEQLLSFSDNNSRRSLPLQLHKRKQNQHFSRIKVCSTSTSTSTSASTSGSFTINISEDLNEKDAIRPEQAQGHYKTKPTTLSRATYIANVLLIDTALPLLVPAIQTIISPSSTSSSSNKITETSIIDNESNKESSNSKWDNFWSSSGGNNSNTNKKHLSNSDRITKALENLGPTFVKFGQAAASRPDIIPYPLASSLRTLQDKMEPFDTTIAKEIIRSDLSQLDVVSDDFITSLLDSLSEVPVAAASVGQVYKGYIQGYGDVAVKVQRPGLKDLVQLDADLLLSIAEFVESIPALPAFPSSPSSGTSTKSSTTIDENLLLPNKEHDQQQQQDRLVATELVKGVNEFMSRLFEELDYRREADNAKRFAKLYSIRGGTEIKCLPSGSGVIVPVIYSEFCTENVLIMEWIEGSKIVNDHDNDDVDDSNQYVDISADANAEVINDEDNRNGLHQNHNGGHHLNGKSQSSIRSKENLALIELGIQCTISQLLETGVMHADPHGGNLLRVEAEHALILDQHPIISTTTTTINDDNGGVTTSIPRSIKKYINKAVTKTKKKNQPGLAYLDFGLLAEVPERARDGLVCAVAQLVFARDVDAVASLFGELMLLPDDIVSDPVERKALTLALMTTFDEVLVFPDNSSTGNGIPYLRFSKLIDALARLIPRFQFELPPYFLNNVRALGTLEGMARSIDPQFNCLRLLYPYALNRLLRNPSGSPVVFRTLLSLITSNSDDYENDGISDDSGDKESLQVKMNNDEQYGIVQRKKVVKLIYDASILLGIPRRQLIWDVIKTRKGQGLIFRISMRDIKKRFRRKLKRFIRNKKKKDGIKEGLLANFLKL